MTFFVQVLQDETHNVFNNNISFPVYDKLSQRELGSFRSRREVKQLQASRSTMQALKTIWMKEPVVCFSIALGAAGKFMPDRSALIDCEMHEF